jgi:hypothetical protein
MDIFQIKGEASKEKITCFSTLSQNLSNSLKNIVKVFKAKLQLKFAFDSFTWFIQTSNEEIFELEWSWDPKAFLNNRKFPVTFETKWWKNFYLIPKFFGSFLKIFKKGNCLSLNKIDCSYLHLEAPNENIIW